MNYLLFDMFIGIPSQRQDHKRIMKNFRVVSIFYYLTQPFILLFILLLNDDRALVDKDYDETYYLINYIYTGLDVSFFTVMIVIIIVKVRKVLKNEFGEEIERNMKKFSLFPLSILATLILTIVFNIIWDRFEAYAK